MSSVVKGVLSLICKEFVKKPRHLVPSFAQMPQNGPCRCFLPLKLLAESKTLIEKTGLPQNAFPLRFLPQIIAIFHLAAAQHKAASHGHFPVVCQHQAAYVSAFHLGKRHMVAQDIGILCIVQMLLCHSARTRAVTCPAVTVSAFASSSFAACCGGSVNGMGKASGALRRMRFVPVCHQNPSRVHFARQLTRAGVIKSRQAVIGSTLGRAGACNGMHLITGIHLLMPLDRKFC